jgi:SPP1 family predicted phage head-tail adaptor
MAKQLNIGELNRRIDIQQEVATQGTSGQEILTWENLACVWSKVSYPMTGGGADIDANQVIVTTRTDFIIRYRDGLDEKMRIVYRGANYGILNITEHEQRNRFLTLQAHKIE